MIPLRADASPLAVVGGRLCTGLLDLTDDLAALDSTGFWAVVVPFDGIPICARFADVRPATAWPGPPWSGPEPASWSTSLDRDAFCRGVEAIRESIRSGDVYQVNLTRRLSAPLPTPPAGTTRLTLFSATSPPNFTVTPLISSALPVPGFHDPILCSPTKPPR